MAFDVEQFFDGNDIAMWKEVVRMEGEMCLGNTVKGTNTSSKFDTLHFKRVEKSINVFGPFWARDNTKTYSPRYKRPNFWGEVIKLDKDRCCRWTTTPSFVQ
jgi:hypothetical protein